jgi:cytoskeleton protein RodZ
MDSTAAPSSSPSIALEPSRSPVLPVETTGNKPELKVGEPETIVMFKATGSSWIQVTDAKGTVVLKRLLGAGESAMATGQLPLAVLVGRVDATTVEIRGKPFDLASVARDNVARFEVRP